MVVVVVVESLSYYICMLVCKIECLWLNRYEFTTPKAALWPLHCSTQSPGQSTAILHVLHYCQVFARAVHVE